MSYKPEDYEIDDLTDFSILKGKASIKLLKPMSQIIVLPPPRTDSLNGIEFITISEYIYRELKNNVKIEKIIKKLRKIREFHFSINDIIFSYVDYKLYSYLNNNNFEYNIKSQIDQELFSLLKLVIDKETLEFINSYRKNENDKIFDDVEEAINDYRIWSNANVNIVTTDAKKLEETFYYRRKLNNVELFRRSPIFIRKITIEANPILGDDFDPRDAISIFNNTEVSKLIPYIQYNGSDQNYYKIWTGSKSKEEKPNYSTIIQDLFNIKTHHIYMVLWVGDPVKDDINNATRKSFKLVTYDIINNIIRFEIPSISESTPNHNEEIINRVKRGIKLDFNILNNNQISGEFFVWSVKNFNEVIFLDYVTIDPVINPFLYYSESRKPYPLKSRYEFYFNEDVHNSTGGYNFQTKLSISSSYITEGTTPKYIVGDEVKSLNIVDKNTPMLDNNIEIGAPYLQVRITSSSITEAERFSRIFNQIIGYIDIMERQYNILNIYKYLLKDNNMLSSGKQKKADVSRNLRTGISRGRQDKDSKIDKLKLVAPDIFSSPYARSICSKPRQPTLVNKEDVVPIGNSEILGHLKGRNDVQVLAFPKPSKNSDGTVVPPRLYFRCNDNEKAIYPGVRENNNNVDTHHEYLPCCWAEDQVHDSTSKYQSYYHGYVKEKNTTTTAYATDKFTGPGQTGKLPPVLSNLLAKYSDNSGQLLRSGTIISPNSIIHVLLEAINDQNYITLNPDRRESYVRGIRTRIYRTINPELLKQELYDWPDEEIKSEFLNTELFFDPALFYRALEETFNINIYVFTVEKRNRSKKGEIKSSDVKLDIPRHKTFHTRIFRPERKTLLIYKHWGSESNAAIYPQCELIIEGQKIIPGSKISIASSIRNRITLFDLNMNTFVYQKIYLNTHSVITWSFNFISPISINSSIDTSNSSSKPLGTDTNQNYQLEARLNLYNMFDYKFDNTTHQFIDSYGKMRGLIFDNISVFFPPTQPLNLPQSISQTVTPLQNILDKFSNSFPTAISVDKDILLGVWYSIYDITQGIYVAVEPVDINDPIVPGYIKNIPLGDSHPMESVQTSLALRYKKMEKTVNVFLQVVIWLYQIFEKNLLSNYTDPTILFRLQRLPNFNTFDSANDAKSFFKSQSTENRVRIFAMCYSILGNLSPVNSIEDIDTSEIYNVDTIPHKLWPDADTLDEALDLIRQSNSRIVVTDGNDLGIYFYNQLFLSRIVYRLSRFISSISSNLRLGQIFNVFQSINDFKQQSETIIIVGETDFKEWISYQQRTNSKFEDVYYKLGVEFRFKINPYIYRDPISKRYYIIQNVVNNDKERALAVAQKWHLFNLNPGPATDPILDIDAPYIKFVVYGISSNNKQLFLRENNTDNSDDYLELLEYGRRDITNTDNNNDDFLIVNEYAAMLPIPNPFV